jgi:predicted secreted protein
MAQTGILNGTTLLVYVGGTAVAGSRTCSISTSMETREATTKDSAGWAESLEGLRSWSVECDGLYAQDAAYGHEELFALIGPTRTKSTLTFATATSGDTIYRGQAYCTQLDLEAGVEDSASWTASFTGTAALTKTTLT